jgi:hypothetical protein
MKEDKKYPRWFLRGESGLIYQKATKNNDIITFFCTICTDICRTPYWDAAVISEKDAEDTRKRLHQEWSEESIPLPNC